MLKFYFLGTANAFGHGGRRSSCYLIHGSMKILVDAGYSALSALRKHKLTHLDLILISHLHPDHCLALPQMALEDYYVLKKENPIQIIGPVGLKEKLKEYSRVMYNEEVTNHLDKLFNIIELGPNQHQEFRSCTVDTLVAAHSGNAMMLIISIDNKTIGYSGDTSFLQDEFEKLVKCDLTIIEATSYNHSIPDHTTVLEIENFNSKYKNEIYLSHLGDSVLANVHKIKPPILLAKDDLIINI